jgi:hypothetical protein
MPSGVDAAVRDAPLKLVTLQAHKQDDGEEESGALFGSSHKQPRTRTVRVSLCVCVCVCMNVGMGECTFWCGWVCLLVWVGMNVGVGGFGCGCRCGCVANSNKCLLLQPSIHAFTTQRTSPTNSLVSSTSRSSPSSTQSPFQTCPHTNAHTYTHKYKNTHDCTHLDTHTHVRSCLMPLDGSWAVWVQIWGQRQPPQALPQCVALSTKMRCVCVCAMSLACCMQMYPRSTGCCQSMCDSRCLGRDSASCLMDG